VPPAIRTSSATDAASVSRSAATTDAPVRPGNGVRAAQAVAGARHARTLLPQGRHDRLGAGLIDRFLVCVKLSHFDEYLPDSGASGTSGRIQERVQDRQTDRTQMVQARSRRNRGTSGYRRLADLVESLAE
jgi:hypothetical protein